MSLLFIWWLISYLLFFSHYWPLRHNKSWHFASDTDKKISKRSSHFESSEWDRGISMGRRQWEKCPLSFFFLPQLTGNSHSWCRNSKAAVSVKVPETQIQKSFSLLRGTVVQKVWETDGHLCWFLLLHPPVTWTQPNLASENTQ